MNENETKNEILIEIPEETLEDKTPLEVEIHEEAGEEKPESETPEMSDEETEALASHPMFPRFARGRQGSFHEILVSFREMLGASRRMDQAETLTAKMTPAATQAVLDVALTERQRAIARAAGMSYREYYNILNG